MNTSSKRLQTLPTIPEDIIIDILSRLPVKSLLRFRLVCKTWCNVIKSPNFISMHHNLGTVCQLLICTNVEKKGYDHVFSLRSNDRHARVLSPDFEIPSTRYHIARVVGSCNGIVCYFDFSGQVFLSNPARREFKKLPPTSIISDLNWWQLRVCFGFDSSNIYEFKVLRLFNAHTRTIMENLESTPKTLIAEMYTLSSNTWRQIEWGLDKKIIFLESTGLFCANSFHFLAESYSSELTIVCFDINMEKFTTMDLPSKADHDGKAISLMVFKEFLSVVFTDAGEYGSVEIWIMKDYGVVESWTKLFKIVPPPPITQAVCFCRTDEPALLLVEDEKYKLATCDLNTLSLESINIDGGDSVHSEVVLHKESLVSIM